MFFHPTWSNHTPKQGPFSIKIHTFRDHLFDVFFDSVLEGLGSHFGIVFGTFLDTFSQLFHPLRGNVHFSKIVTSLSVLLGFGRPGVTPGGHFSSLFRTFFVTPAGHRFRPRFASIFGLLLGSLLDPKSDKTATPNRSKKRDEKRCKKVPKKDPQIIRVRGCNLSYFRSCFCENRYHYGRFAWFKPF